MRYARNPKPVVSLNGMRIIAAFQTQTGELWKVDYTPPPDGSTEYRVFNVVAPDSSIAHRFVADQPDPHNLKLLQAEKAARDKAAELAGWPINPQTGHRGWDTDEETGEHRLFMPPKKPKEKKAKEPSAEPPITLREEAKNVPQ